jgi:hypothetical protein
MLRLTSFLLLFSIIFIFSHAAIAQDTKDASVVLIETFKLKSIIGEDAEAFSAMLKRTADVYNNDPRVIRSYILRHYWGSDSRDLVFVYEFKNESDLYSFANEFDKLLEKALPKEQFDADYKLWNKYVGQHADEIYNMVSDTKK